MCTVLFIPSDNKLYFASLRDESPQRPIASLPEITPGLEMDYLAPGDAKAGGAGLVLTLLAIFLFY